jgi:long-chain fatty acid transport protein
VEKFQDTWHAAFGLEYLYDPCLKVSAGVAYDSSAVTKKERTFDFPVGSQWRIGTGFEYALKENMFLNMGYEIMWSGNLPVFQQRGSLGGIVAGRFKNLCIHFLDCSLNIVF